MGIAKDLAHEFRWMVPQLPLKDLAAFSGNLATCLAAGLNVPDSVETCTRSSPNLLLRTSGPIWAERTRGGATLSEALDETAYQLPRFYLPVLRCGEQSGRTDEALHYLQQHCALLERPYQAMRSLWLVPLVIFSVASILLIFAHFLLTPFFTAVKFLVRTVMRYAVAGAVVVLVLNVPQLRRLWEQLLLALPFVGPAARELAVNRFLHSLNLMYRTSGMAVPRMVQTACSAVDNTIVRNDFLAALPVLEGGGTLTESLADCPSLTFDQKATISAGEEAGRIEDALSRLCQQTSESVQFRLRGFQAIYFRLITTVVVLSTAMTLRALISVYFLR